MKLAEAPRLPKLPFILGDIALLLLAATVAFRHPTPWSPVFLLVVTGCVVAGAIASFIPFLVNYARDQEAAGASLRHELGEQFKRIMVASEHFQHATVQLNAIEEAAVKSLQAAGSLPGQIEEKIAEFQRKLEADGDSARLAADQETYARLSTELERLTASVETLAGIADEWRELESTARAKLADIARMEDRLAGMLDAAEAGPATRKPPGAEVNASTASVPEASHADAALPETNTATVGPPDAAAAPVPEPDIVTRPPRKARASKKAPNDSHGTETPSAPDSEPPPAELVVEPVADEAPAPDDFSQVSPEEVAPVRSVDGATRLIVTAYVGIGNKLYLRGDGPGLSWEKGIPLQFVSIGRWRWETTEASESFECRIYKNDKIESPLGLLTVAPGVELEVTATF